MLLGFFGVRCFDADEDSIQINEYGRANTFSFIRQMRWRWGESVSVDPIDRACSQYVQAQYTAQQQSERWGESNDPEVKWELL